MSDARVSTRPVTSKSPLMHPLVLVLFPIPAMVAILFGDKIEFSLVALVIGLIAAAFHGWKFFRTALVTTLSTLLILWIGFSISLPSDPVRGGESADCVAPVPSDGGQHLLCTARCDEDRRGVTSVRGDSCLCRLACIFRYSD